MNTIDISEIEHESDPYRVISFFQKQQMLGVYYVLCKRLKVLAITDIVPQLIQQMFRDTVSTYPIYELLLYKAKMSSSFKTRLFLELKNILILSNEHKATLAYYLCCEIMRSSEKRTIRRISIRGHRGKGDSGKVNGEKGDNTKGNNAEKGDNTKVNAEKGNDGRCKYDDNDTKGNNTVIINNHSRSTLMKSNSVLTKPIIKNRLSPIIGRGKRYISRIKKLEKTTNTTFNFPVIMLFFAKAAACIVSDSISKFIEEYCRSLENRKCTRKLTISQNTTIRFKRTVLLYENMAEISSKLRSIPKGIRQRMLEVYLEHINMNITNPLCTPFDKGHFILRLIPDESLMLDSAENAPYLVIAEVTTSPRYRVVNEDPRKERTEILLSHLSSINELTDSNDISAIRENILEALEQTLFGSFTVEEKNERKEQKVEIEEYGGGGGKVQKWGSLVESVRRSSRYSSLPGWTLKSFIVKMGNAVNPEYLAYQIITVMKNIFALEKSEIYLKNYKIYLVSDQCAFIETVTGTASIHNIKKRHTSLVLYFNRAFSNFPEARYNFLVSLVGYSLASYVLLIKDRHNGNILIDNEGHMIHVDFGFILGRHPGIYSVENAPFKLSSDYLELIDIDQFRSLFIEGFQAIRKNANVLLALIEMMEGSGTCDVGSKELISARLKLEDENVDVPGFCNGLIDRSIKNVMTMVYDRFQYFSNGYY